MKKTQLLLLFGLFFILTANSQTKTENRTIGNFSKIDAKGSFKIVLVAGDSNSLTIEADESALPFIKTEVKGNTLNIYSDGRKKANYKGSVTIKVPFKKLDEVKFSGSGTISSNDALNSDNFNVSMNGSGKVELNISAKNVNGSLNGSGKLELKLNATETKMELNGSGKVILQGKTNNFVGEVHGSGELNGSELVSQNSDVNVHGSGNLKIHTTELLKANVHGSGKIKYKGDPKKVDKNVDGSGSISKE